MTRWRGGAVALATAALLAGCSGADDDPAPASTSVAPPTVTPMTPPPISPRTTVTFEPGETLPPAPTGAPVPIPSDPQD